MKTTPTELRSALQGLRDLGLSDRYMPRLVRAVADLDRATKVSMEQPAWDVFVIVGGSSKTVTRHAATAAAAIAEAKAEGYRVTGLAKRTQAS